MLLTQSISYWFSHSNEICFKISFITSNTTTKLLQYYCSVVCQEVRSVAMWY